MNNQIKEKLLDHYKNSMPVEVDRDYAEHLLDQAITQAVEEKEKEISKYLWKFAEEECDSFEHVGIHRCSYGHCERCGVCDVLSEILDKLTK